MKLVWQHVFWRLVLLGRPFGGIRPRRIMHWIARRAFDASDAVGGVRYLTKTSWGGQLRLHPYYYLDREIIVQGCYDRSLHSLIERRVQPGMTVLDVGANMGEIAMHMAKRVGTSGRVYAFEPVPAVLQRLRENVDLNHLHDVIEIADFALSSDVGSAAFAIADADKENQGMGSLVNRHNSVVSSEILVSTMTLDKFVSDKGIQHIDLIKVDIQGGEIGFIEGGRNTLTTMKPDLVMELSASDLAALGRQPADLIRLIQQQGYRAFAFGRHGVTRCEITQQNAHTTSCANVLCTPVDRGPT